MGDTLSWVEGVNNSYEIKNLQNTICLLLYIHISFLYCYYYSRKGQLYKTFATARGGSSIFFPGLEQAWWLVSSWGSRSPL